MIIGCGIDIIELHRVRELIDRHGERFLSKVFTDAEMAYCRDKTKSWQHFAGRFAVKEAVLKSLGTGVQLGISLKDVEVKSCDSGAPGAVLTGGAEKRAKELGVKNLHISISHSETHAVA
jgi:holo-[acyl-carrier-protein] synthase